MTQPSGIQLDDDPEFWLDVGIDIAPRIWVDIDVLSASELRELGREQLQNPVPGENRAIADLEAAHVLRRRDGTTQRQGEAGGRGC